MKNVANSSERRHEQTNLLVLQAGRSPKYSRFGQFVDWIQAGDLVVVNDAGTLPASFFGVHQPSGRHIEIRLAMRLQGASRWRVVLFGEGDWRTPTELRKSPPELRVNDRVEVSERLWFRVTDLRAEASSRLIDIEFQTNGASLWQEILKEGRPIQYSYHKEEIKIWDQQTLFSGPPVAFEPPSASFPLTWELLEKLKRKGVAIGSLTHATGISDSGDQRVNALLPFPEETALPYETRVQVLETRVRGGRVIAIGTGVMRALESWNGDLCSSEVFVSTAKITASWRRRFVDGLLTGLHESGASHLDLLESFINRKAIEEAYEKARQRGFLWHEYGDVCLII